MNRSTFISKSLALLGLGLSLGCTREMPKPARMVIQLPAAQSFKASSKKITALGAGSPTWGVADPTIYADISCYAVLVEGPEPNMSSGVCTRDSDSSVYIRPGVGGGAYPAGGTIEIIVPAGNSRRVALVGFAASSPAACQDFKLNGGPQYSLLSAPFVISETTLDLAPGTTQLTMFASLTGAVKLKDCDGFGGNPSGSLPALSVADVTTTEGLSSTFAISLSSVSTSDVTFSFQAFPITATNAVDYVLSSGVATILAGASSAQIPFAAIDDASYEPSETFALSLSGVSGARLGRGAALATIIDNEAPPTLSILGASASEGQTVQFIASLSSASFSNVAFNYQTFSGTAQTSVDLPNSVGAGTIASGSTQLVVSIPTTQDAIYEGNETFTVSLLAMAGASPGATTATGTIVDNDTPPTILSSGISVSESMSFALVQISLSNSSGLPVSFNYSTISATASAAADFTFVSGSFTLAAGTSLGAISIPLLNDGVVEGNELFNVSFSAAVGATLGASQASVTIIDDDSVMPAISVLDASVTEGGTVQINFIQDMSYGANTTFSFSSASGTATSGSDFTSSAGLVTILAGQTIATYSLITTEDALYEGTENFTITLTAPTNATILDGLGNVNISDNDSAPTISIYDTSSLESTNLFFIVSLSTISAVPVSLNFATNGSGTATVALDFINTTGSVTISAGTTMANISVPVVSDLLYEISETVNVTLTAVTGATIVDGLAVGTIIEDDGPPVADFPDVITSEGNTALLTVLLDAPSGLDATFSFDTLSGTASSGVDFVSVNQTFTIAAGLTLIQIPVAIIDDASFEGSESFTVSLTNGVDLGFVDNSSIVTINDNDPGPAVSIYDASTSEGGSVYFLVSFSTATVSPASFFYQTYDLSAQTGTDFISTSGLLSVSGGTSQTQIYVATINDSLYEGNETFLISLSGLNMLDPGTLTATGTIYDNDSMPTLSIGNPITTEGAPALFVVSLTAPSGLPVTFDFISNDMSAVQGSDYNFISGTATIASGQDSITIAVTTLDNALYEYSEGFSISLSAINNANSGVTVGYANINDNDSLPNLYIADNSISEAGGILFVTAYIDSVSEVETTFYYSTGPGTAAGGSDYFFAGGSMSIPAGSTNIQIPVSIADDSLYELTEIFYISITSNANSSLVDGTAVLTINDDEPIPTLSIFNASTTEGGVLYASISLSAPSSLDTFVNYQTVAVGSATSGVDFISDSGNFSIPFGSTVGWVTIATFDDSVPEPQESFIITLSGAVNAALPAPVATFYINDNETPPSLFVTDATVIEGDTLLFKVSLNYVTEANITFDYTLADQTATSGIDYPSSGIFSFTIPAGISLTAIPVISLNDTAPEPIESFSLSLSNVAYAIPAIPVAKGVILNEDKFTVGWTAGNYLKASNSEMNDNFGYSVAVTDSFVAVGSPLEDSSVSGVMNGTFATADNSMADAGAVYVFGRSGMSWEQEAYLKAADPAVSDNFGNKVAAQNDTLVVGAMSEDSNATGVINGTGGSISSATLNSGAAYIFRRTGNTWIQEAYVKAADPTAADSFGYSLAIDNNTVVIGAYLEDSNATGVLNGTAGSANATATSAGAAYVYQRTGNSWVQVAYLKGATSDANDNFGKAVAVSRNQIVVGVPNEASNVATVINGTAGSTNNTMIGSGAVYVFKGNGTTWMQSAYLKASNVNMNQGFGSSIAIFGETVIVGAPLESSNQNFITIGTSASSNTTSLNSGAAYVYQSNSGTWSQMAYLKSSNSEGADSFGSSVSIWGDRVAIGSTNEDSSDSLVINGTLASTDNSATSTGAVYMFERNGSSWMQTAFVKPPRQQMTMNFGTSVELNGDYAMVGAPFESSNFSGVINGPWAAQDVSAPSAGAAFGFEYKGSPQVIIQQAPGQIDPAVSLPIAFTVEFSKPINPATFTTADIVQSGTATGVVWNLTNPTGDNRRFDLTATSGSTGTYIPTISSGTINDVTGAVNLPSSMSFDGKVSY